MPPPTRLTLQGGYRQTRDPLASAGTCINLYGEKNPPDAVVPMTYYPTPGLTQVSNVNRGPAEAFYISGAGIAWAVWNGVLYTVTDGGATATQVNTLTGHVVGSGPVRMQDNGLILLIVDGSAGGWYVSLNAAGLPANNFISTVADPAWQGGSSVTIIDTFFVLSVPNSNTFYLSPSNYDGGEAFDPEYVAAKTTYPDTLAAVVAVGQYVYMIGRQTSEIWYDAGGADFPLQRVSGILVSYGTTWLGSIVEVGGGVVWLASDQHGFGQVMQAQGASVQRISTHPIEVLLNNLAGAPVTDVIACVYEQQGHEFYCLTSINRGLTVCFDMTEGEWHVRRSSATPNGSWLIQYAGMTNGQVIGIGYDNLVYRINLGAVQENGAAMYREITLPHAMSDGLRTVVSRFAVDMATSNGPSGTSTVNVAWSLDRGATFSGSATLSLNSSALQLPSVWRLGQVRDIVFRIDWSDPWVTALNGAFIWAQPAAS